MDVRTSPVKRGRSVCRTYENYVDGYKKLPLRREANGKTGNLPITLWRGDKTLVATVEPSELQGPPGSSLLWSDTRAKVL